MDRIFIADRSSLKIVRAHDFYLHFVFCWLKKPISISFTPFSLCFWGGGDGGELFFVCYLSCYWTPRIANDKLLLISFMASHLSFGNSNSITQIGLEIQISRKDSSSGKIDWYCKKFIHPRLAWSFKVCGVAHLLMAFDAMECGQCLYSKLHPTWSGWWRAGKGPPVITSQWVEVDVTETPRICGWWLLAWWWWFVVHVVSGVSDDQLEILYYSMYRSMWHWNKKRMADIML